MFFIAEAGARIHTPLDTLVKPRSVEELDKTAATHAVEEDEPGPEQPPQKRQAVRQRVKQTYVENDEAPAARHRVKFAREIMSSPVFSGRAGQSLFDIWRLFSRHRVHHLPILDDHDKLQGIVSDRDILRFAVNAGRAISDRPINQLMTRAVLCATVDTEVRELAEVMLRRAIGAIPLVDEHEQIEGIVSRTDILRTLVHRAPLDLWT